MVVKPMEMLLEPAVAKAVIVDIDSESIAGLGVESQDRRKLRVFRTRPRGQVIRRQGLRTGRMSAWSISSPVRKLDMRTCRGEQ